MTRKYKYFFILDITKIAEHFNCNLSDLPHLTELKDTPSFATDEDLNGSVFGNDKYKFYRYFANPILKTLYLYLEQMTCNADDKHESLTDTELLLIDDYESLGDEIEQTGDYIEDLESSFFSHYLFNCVIPSMKTQNGYMPFLGTVS